MKLLLVKMLQNEKQRVLSVRGWSWPRIQILSEAVITRQRQTLLFCFRLSRHRRLHLFSSAPALPSQRVQRRLSRDNVTQRRTPRIHIVSLDEESSSRRTQPFELAGRPPPASSAVADAAADKKCMKMLGKWLQLTALTSVIRPGRVLFFGWQLPRIAAAATAPKP